ncbi:SMP-30/gluconolactonase/LRE family protein [Sulfurimonas sp.]|uniref:SMP-30/gluconolactonase/LRE family protein n=1 Tax=Sulfurimonas sp. TaxID=2022749 RepID=UPI0025DE624B|nr:SMP-30/gluconolactonase/LRE family protein [Sulfurimonas sp.]MDD5156657.1 SMP-30/gluconolactonase/LRE family protein [Sulfurimonas sp.]
MIKLVVYNSMLFLALILATGCVAQKEKITEGFVVPVLPEEPRLFYIATYTGERDFEQESTLDTFIGVEDAKVAKSMVKPYGVAAYKEKIFTTDTAQGVVFVIDRATKKVSFLGDKPSGKLGLPVSIAFDGKGLTYVSDAKLKKVYAYDDNGSVQKIFGVKDEFTRPTGIAINRDLGLLYITDTLQHNIKVYTLDGVMVQTIGKRGIEDGEFNYPTNLSIDRRNGNLIVGDTQNFRIQIFDKNGKFLSKFGKVGDKPGMFARPKGVAVDSEGHIYAADAAFNNVQIFNDKGELLLYFGGAGTTPGTFHLPSSLYCDEEDRLYTTEGFNSKVQVFQYISEVWKKNHPNEYKKLLEPR